MNEKKNNIKVLVVDDEKIICDFFVRLLTLQGGLEVVSVKDGYEAIEAVKGTRFDLIFLDMRMPGLDGLETYRTIRELDKEARVVMMTGYAVDNLLQQAEKEGAYGFIRKPFEIKEIRTIVKGIGETKETLLSVLVVDDDEAILKFFSNFLKDKVKKLKTAKDEPEAIEAVKAESFDIIFLDLMLNGIDGIGTYKTIKKFRPEANIVVITGYPQKGKEAQEQLGVTGCLYKPFEIERLISELDKMYLKTDKSQKK